MVPVSARSMQRFLTEARWGDDRVIARLQEYLGPKLEHPLAVWVFDGSDFPKQGVKSVGVARQYYGALGKIANCQAGVFLAHVGPRGRALVDKRLYLPKAWSFRCMPLRGCGRAGGPAAVLGEDGPGPSITTTRYEKTRSGLLLQLQTVHHGRLALVRFQLQNSPTSYLVG